MLNLSKLNIIRLSVVIIVGLNGCGGSGRSDDIAAVGIATQPPATLPSASATETPLAAPPTASTSEPTALAPAEPTLAPAAAAGPVVVFKLSGGIVGFCDELTIDGAGAYVLQICQQPDEITGTLEQADLDALTAWRQNLASFQFKSEDNPGGPDNLVVELVFNGQGSTEADEAQKRMILDWANGLLIRARSQAVAPPTPEPLVTGPNGLCPDISRPAVVVIDYERPGGLTLVDPNSRAECDLPFAQTPSGRIVTAGGQIYFPIFDQEAKTMTVWTLRSTGEQIPLPFTAVTVENFGPYSFAVSGDGSKIAWARAMPDLATDPPIYRNDLWLANLDGSN
ncbi:MAG TPA: hypothetical protein VEC93_15135, partial [Anaerolineae bacterium]|nr:hypothetical protein [Anaerolineae bacterium]